MIYYMYSI